MATTVVPKSGAIYTGADAPDPAHPVSVNIKPILDPIAGKLTDDEIDQWFVDLYIANEERGLSLEMTGEGELIISPTVNRGGLRAEFQLAGALYIWEEEHGGEAAGTDANMSLPDGSRIRPDALWMSPEQVSELPPAGADRPIPVCPAFVAEIVSGTDTFPPLQRKMDVYMANGARLGWQIDPYRRRVHVYRAGENVETLDNPETLSGDPVMPGFVFGVRQRIFTLQDDTGD